MKNLIGKRLIYNNNLYIVIKPFNKFKDKWIIQSDNKEYFIIDKTEMLILIEDFEMKNKEDNNKENDITLLDKINNAINLKNELKTDKLILELTEDEILFMKLWISTGLNQLKIINEFNNKNKE